MLTVVIIVTVVLQVVLTVGGLAIWNGVRKNDPQTLTRTFFIIMGMRFVLSLAVFIIGLFVMRECISDIKVYAIVFAVLYLVVLAFDTLYFLRGLKSMDKENK